MCGCLVILLGSAFPRLALLFTWIFTDRVDIAFDGWALPLLGLLFLPYTTFFYVLAYAPIVGVQTHRVVLRDLRVLPRRELVLRRRPVRPAALRAGADRKLYPAPSGTLARARRPTGLPVRARRPRAARRARRTPGGAVLVAPPGTGKTTSPRCAWWTSRGWPGARIVVLEPRRLATRAAARRMAALLGEEVGGTVGYTTRDDRRTSAATRIEVVTEGVLTRRLQRDPSCPASAS